MLLTKEVEVRLDGSNIPWYEAKGYEMPRRQKTYVGKNGRICLGRLCVPKGTKIKIKIEDVADACRSIISYKCDNCGKIINTQYNLYKMKKYKDYCNDCVIKLFKSGKNSTLWKNNISLQDRKHMQESRKSNEAYRKWAQLIVSKDNYKCIKCNSNKKLEAHHLDGWHWCKEKRYDINNGVSLCAKCHKNFHSIYGFKNNTKEQFIEWYDKELILNPFTGDILTSSPIINIITKEKIIYSSQYSNIPKYNSTYARITACCKNHKRYGFNYFVKEQDYINMTNDDIASYIINIEKSTQNKMVVDINNRFLFKSTIDALRYYNKTIDKSQSKLISQCCRHLRDTYLKDYNNKDIIWMYAYEYIEKYGIDKFKELERKENVNE